MSHNISRPIQPGNLHIGIVATRLGTTDGVALEAHKWCTVLTRLGHTCFFFTGLSDQQPEGSHVVPEAHFAHPDIQEVFDLAFSLRERPPSLSQKIRGLADHLKETLYTFAERYEIDVLLVENALAIPLNIPLGIALTEFIAESGLPTIAHHHDLYWERQRFMVNCVWDHLDACFPPRLPHIQHVVISSPAATQLSYRRGISAMIVPNVMDFETPPPEPDAYTSSLRADLQLKPAEHLVLQPTRVVKRKGIEHSIELVRRMRLPARLIVSHAGGDEGPEYERYLREFSDLLNVPTLFVGDIIDDRRGTTPDGRKVYALWDVYPFANLVTYPSLIEGFGNAFLEAIYFRKPILVNDYGIYHIDIKPRGFRAIEMHGFLTSETVEQVEQVLQFPEAALEMTEPNYQLGRRFFSFRVLEARLKILLGSITGELTDGGR